jgi:hypothetical protein
MADDQRDSLELFAELLREHSLVLEEKARHVERAEVPPTALNQRLTRVVERMTEEASARRAAGDPQSEELRAMLHREAGAGSLAADEVIDRLSEEDRWWREPE